MTEQKAFPPLSKWQSYVWSHRPYWWILGGGRRSLKSTTAWVRGSDTCIHGGNVSWYCANKELADENWQEICDFLEPYASRVNRHQSAELWFDTEKGRGVFKRRSGFGRGAGRAGTSNLLIFDEMQLLEHALFLRATPSLLTTQGAVVGTLTAPSTPTEFLEAQWIRDILDDAGPDGFCRDPKRKRWWCTQKSTEPEDIAFVIMMTEINWNLADPTVFQWYMEHVSYDKNGYRTKGKHVAWTKYIKLAQESLDQERYDMGESDYLREYNFVWTVDTNKLVYANIRDGVHRKEEFDFDPNSVVFWSIDRGEGLGWHVLNMYCRMKIGERSIKNRTFMTDEEAHTVPIFAYRAFDECATHDVISEGDMLERALKLCIDKHYPLPQYVVYDVRAPGYRNEIRDAGLVPIARNVPVEDGIRKVRRLIDRNCLQVHPRCQRLWQNLTHYSRDEKGFPVEDRDNDAADELRYGVWISDSLAGIPDDSMSNRELVTDIAMQGQDKEAERLRQEAAGVHWFFF